MQAQDYQAALRVLRNQRVFCMAELLQNRQKT